MPSPVTTGAANHVWFMTDWGFSAGVLGLAEFGLEPLNPAPALAEPVALERGEEVGDPLGAWRAA